MDLFLLLLMLLVSQQVSGKLRPNCPLSLEHRDESHPWSYYGQGDHLIGIVLCATRMLREMLLFNMAPNKKSHSQTFNDMARILRFIMTIEEINKNQRYLQNVTLGYNIQNDYFNTIGTSEALLDMLSTGDANVPNYSCGRKDNVLALLDAAASDISIQMSTLVGTYKVAQTSYEIVSEALSDKSQFPFFHPMFPKEGIQYPGIVQLLLHFRWTLIGLFASDTENGENFMRTFTQMLVRNGICVVISQRFSTTRRTAPLRDAVSKWRQVNVFLHSIEHVPLLERIIPFHLTFRQLSGPIEGKVWILTIFEKHYMQRNKVLKYIHSVWIFSLQEKKDNALYPYHYVERQYRDRSLHCSFSKHAFSVKGRKRCTQKASLENKIAGLWIETKLKVFSIVRTLTHVLNAAYASISRRKRQKDKKKLKASRLQPWQLHPFMKKNVFCNISLWKLYVDQNGDIAADLDIVSGFRAKDYLIKGKLGSFKKKGLFVNQDALQQLMSLNKVRKILVSFLYCPKT
ncbi:vomeronasal type-2 receptor 26-like [Pantherophis guttatus]|uniref:Vomeronasal type-2 receptor 26-like n=1 Tax=Pantherophis guttatus TaxID=94885 RepID=A0ABM3YUS7_PANGU|nr:vomeronasal type-2 receptor 26-like [Pantherophis guttatus]